MATINYNGMELEEFNPDKSVSFNPPIKCVGWNDKDVKAEFELSSALSKDIWIHRFIGKSNDAPVAFMFCALLPDPPKPRRATNRELARWLIEGKAQIRHSDSDMVYVGWNYKEFEDDLPCSNNVLVRKWSDTEWHEPTVDYMGLEDK